MPMISVKDNKNNGWKRNAKTKKKQQQQQKHSKGTEAIAKVWETNDFFLDLKLGFVELICKAFLIFKSNLELALSIILKKREFYELKHVAVECRYLKI